MLGSMGRSARGEVPWFDVAGDPAAALDLGLLDHGLGRGLLVTHRGVDRQRVRHRDAERVRHRRGARDGLEAAAPGGFCQLWPKAKPILTAASAFIFLLGPQAGAILTGLIKIGDEIFSQSCS